MHILFLNSWYPSKIFPTNGDFVQRHAESVAIKYKVTCIHVVTDAHQQEATVITDDLINEVRTLVAYVRPSSSKLTKLYRFFMAYIQLFKSVEEVSFVHVNHIYPAGIVALYLKITKGIDYIITEHWTGFHNVTNLPWNRFVSFFMRRVSKSAKFICPVTKDLAIAMAGLGLSGRYQPVPNVVNTDVFSIKQSKNKLKFTIVHVSNMDDHHKNISGLIRVIGQFQKQVDEFDLFMIGNQPRRYKLYFKEVGVREKNVHFVDNLPQEKLKIYMQSADIFVLFSNEENLPCVILESFSCGVPVISTNVGGIKEYFPSNFGRLISLGNEEELLQVLLDIKEQNIQFETPNRMHDYAVKHFNKTTIANQFSNLYEREPDL